jgi:hypothetical protein
MKRCTTAWVCKAGYDRKGLNRTPGGQSVEKLRVGRGPTKTTAGRVVKNVATISVVFIIIRDNDKDSFLNIFL